jgi:hypothetical protein
MALALLLSTACAGQAATASSVQDLIGDAACRADSDCRTVALPNQACGGPQGWLAFSTLRTTGAAIQAALLRLQSRVPGEVSTCAVMPDPGAACVRRSSAALGQCRLRPRGSWAPTN